MKCKDVQFLLPLYPDNVLDEAEQRLVDQHIDVCPVCRQKIFDLKEIRNSLRAAAKPVFPTAVAEMVRRQVAERINVSANPMFMVVDQKRRWVDVWLMPFAVGSLCTLVLGFTLLWVIVSGEITPRGGSVAANTSTTTNTTFLFPYQPPADGLALELTPLEYASSRASYSRESPSINPQGSLVMLTKDLVDEIKDEEVTVVADVHGDGTASIAQVVEPSSDRRAVAQLQQALDSARSAPAFVPASYDNRTEAVRVVFKIQSVSVSTRLR